MRKTIVVTGGAKGIGKSIVELLSTKYNIVFSYNKSEEQAKKLEQELINACKNVCAYKADVSKREEAKGLIEYSIKTFGNVDGIINNAGISQIKVFNDITDEDWENMMKNNLYSVFYMCQEGLKYMIPKKSGIIINISSIWGITGASCESHYSVSKAGIDALTKSLAKELGPSNIRVNSIAPGIIDTDMNKELNNEEIKELKEEIPLGKIGNTIDIAKCVEWILEDSYVTGQIISINGGWLI